MTPIPMKMTTPVRPSPCKPEPDITHSNETYMSNRIPAGLPYLTGFVINEGIAAEAQD